eukprot:TRINITY_DN4640_c0_g1_i2.p1 TRINITY_DN4640_c0_g1~~TRINITY_DN4640_c0_g1_i2.p1  ORF type:complete len:671 (-),score=141.51 TRINITY_DN4640_c0_g1_i2:113-2125(-)
MIVNSLIFLFMILVTHIIPDIFDNLFAEDAFLDSNLLFFESGNKTSIISNQKETLSDSIRDRYYNLQNAFSFVGGGAGEAGTSDFDLQTDGNPDAHFHDDYIGTNFDLVLHKFILSNAKKINPLGEKVLFSSQAASSKFTLRTVSGHQTFLSTSILRYIPHFDKNRTYDGNQAFEFSMGDKTILREREYTFLKELRRDWIPCYQTRFEGNLQSFEFGEDGSSAAFAYSQNEYDNTTYQVKTRVNLRILRAFDCTSHYRDLFYLNYTAASRYRPTFNNLSLLLSSRQDENRVEMEEVEEEETSLPITSIAHTDGIIVTARENDPMLFRTVYKNDERQWVRLDDAGAHRSILEDRYGDKNLTFHRNLGLTFLHRLKRNEILLLSLQLMSSETETFIVGDIFVSTFLSKKTPNEEESAATHNASDAGDGAKKENVTKTPYYWRYLGNLFEVNVTGEVFPEAYTRPAKILKSLRSHTQVLISFLDKRLFLINFKNSSAYEFVSLFHFQKRNRRIVSLEFTDNPKEILVLTEGPEGREFFILVIRDRYHEDFLDYFLETEEDLFRIKLDPRAKIDSNAIAGGKILTQDSGRRYLIVVMNDGGTGYFRLDTKNYRMSGFSMIREVIDLLFTFLMVALMAFCLNCFRRPFNLQLQINMNSQQNNPGPHPADLPPNLQ